MAIYKINFTTDNITREIDIVKLTNVLKKIFWISIAPVMIGLVFQSGVVWNKVNSNEQKLINTVSKEIFKITDKKIDGIAADMKIVATYIKDHDMETVKSINEISTKVALLTLRVDNLEGVKIGGNNE